MGIRKHDASLSRPDHEHVAAMRDGNAASWAKLYERHRSGILRFCGNFTTDTQQAEEWAEETFLRLREKADQFEAGAELRPWLYKIARNICLEAKAKKKEVVWDESLYGSCANLAAVVDSKPSPASKVANAELFERAKKALNVLSEDNRSILILKYVEGLSREEIAAVMDLPKTTIKARLFHSMAELRKQLGA